VEAITKNDFLARLPFNTSDFTFEDVLEEVNSLISPYGEVIKCVEQPCAAAVNMEDGLLISRSAPDLPDLTSLPADVSKLPTWQQAAIKQAKSLKGGK